MEIQFIGGARTVTGSQHLLSINGKKLLLECGLFQGRRKDTYEKNKNFIYNPSNIDAMILSHSHIDHRGNIPKAIPEGTLSRNECETVVEILVNISPHAMKQS